MRNADVKFLKSLNVKRAAFSAKGSLTEVEFFEPPVKLPTELLAEQEKDIEDTLKSLPEDVRQEIMRQRRERLAYAAS